MTTNTVASGKSLTLKSGGPEILVSNLGQGNTTVVVTIGKKKPVTQVLQGQGAVQSFQNIVYPVTIDNKGPDAVQVQS